LVSIATVVFTGYAAERVRPTRENPQMIKWRTLLQEQASPSDRLAARDARARRQAEAAIQLLKSGDPEPVFRLLRHASDPSVRSYIVRDIAATGAWPNLLIQRLDIEPDASARRAIILSLGGFTDDQIPESRRTPLADRLLRMYREDADSGIHSAVDWLLRHSKQGLMERRMDWHQAEALRTIDRALASAPSKDRQWFVTREGQTFAVIRGPVKFVMGAPGDEPGRDKPDDEEPHLVRLPRSFAISTKEVTVGQFQRFLDANPAIKRMAQAAGSRDPTREGPILAKKAFDDECPQVSMTWFEAAQYCNWLSAQEGIPQSQWCYPPLEQIKEGMELARDHLHRTGYRLPTEAEWEFACRAGSTTSRFFGASEALLAEYAWSTATTFDERPWPVGQLKPNDLGLFDMYGNVWEWCHDHAKKYPSAPGDSVREDVEDTVLIVSAQQKRPRRGGSYTYGSKYMRSAHRGAYIPDERRDSVGFRVARSILMSD
jgi:formylglycine-generating enzyme required for sulfatase activity